eukprot:3904940-Alexandrium_andersonii.AAC.1
MAKMPPDASQLPSTEPCQNPLGAGPRRTPYDGRRCAREATRGSERSCAYHGTPVRRRPERALESL